MRGKRTQATKLLSVLLGLALASGNVNVSAVAYALDGAKGAAAAVEQTEVDALAEGGAASEGASATEDATTSGAAASEDAADGEQGGVALEAVGERGVVEGAGDTDAVEEAHQAAAVVSTETDALTTSEELAVVADDKGEQATAGAAGANPTRGSPVARAVTQNLLRAGEAKEVDASVTSLEIQNLSGEEVDRVFWTDKFYLAMDWDASSNGADLHEGDYFVMTLPDEMVFPSDSAATNFDIKDDSGNVIAKAKVTPGDSNKGGTVTVTFTDWVEDKEDVKGSIRLAAQFDREQVTVGEENEFSVTVGSEVSQVSVTVVGPKELEDETVGKWGQSTSNPNEAEWWVRINHAKDKLSNVVITDYLSGGNGDEVYIPESFALLRVEMDAYGNVDRILETVDLADKLTIADDGRSFTIGLGDVNGDQYRLTYRTTYNPGTTLRNNLTLTSTEKSVTKSASHISADSGGSGGGTLANRIRIAKVDAQDRTIVLAGATFEVTAPNGTTFTLTTGADGTVTSGALTSGTYTVRETSAPVGYELDDTEYELVVSSDGGALRTITNEPILTEVQVAKKWVGPEGGPVTVHLLADGEDTGQALTLSADNGWSGTFEGLRQYATDGAEIVYTVEEDGVDGYRPQVSGDASSGFVVTNTSTETTSVSGTKTWDDDSDRDGVRPASITIRLRADGTEVDSATVTADDDWSWSFDGIARYDSTDGHEIVYSVTEDAVDDYSASYSADGLSVTNAHTPGKTSVSVTKAWDDEDDADGIRPESVTVHLLANGDDTGKTLILSEDNSWTGSFTELDAREDGKDIAYTVEEDDVDGYAAAIIGDATEGFVITNSHTPDEPEEPTKPTKPEEPTEPEVPGGSEEPKKPTQKKATPKKETKATPKKATKGALPKMGDESPLAPVGMLGAAGIACVGLALGLRRRKADETAAR